MTRASGSRPRVVVTHRVHPDVLGLLEERCEVVANQTPRTLARHEMLSRARDAEALLVFMPDRIDEAFLEACPKLRVVAGALKGYDNVDAEACTRRGIWLTISEDLLTGPTAELAVGLMIGLMRRIGEGDRFVRSGAFTGWRPELYGTGLAGSTVGIVGMGAVGRAVAQRLIGFEASVVYHDVRRLPQEVADTLQTTQRPFEELVARSDVVLVVVHLEADTYHMINRHTLSEMKSGSLLVNVGRGSVVDETAVADALQAGRLGGYAADVFEMEDRSVRGGPDRIPDALLAHERTLFTPHLGSAVTVIRRAIELAAARSILQAVDGHKPAGAVNDVSEHDLPAAHSEQYPVPGIESYEVGSATGDEPTPISQADRSGGRASD